MPTLMEILSEMGTALKLIPWILVIVIIILAIALITWILWCFKANRMRRRGERLSDEEVSDE